MPTFIIPALTATSRSGAWFISEFRRTGATSPATARPVRDPSWAEVYIFQQLLKIGVLRETGRGLYYLDEGALAPLEGQARRLWITIAVVGGVALVLGLLTRFFL
jgi:hypothetical protein